MKIDFRPREMPLNARLEQGADKLESTFFAEMLKITIPDGSTGAFGGGVGESQFSSFMTEHYADALASRIDLGLAARVELSGA